MKAEYRLPDTNLTENALKKKSSSKGIGVGSGFGALDEEAVLDWGELQN